MRVKLEEKQHIMIHNIKMKRMNSLLNNVKFHMQTTTHLRIKEELWGEMGAMRYL